MRLHPAELNAIRSTLGALDPLGRTADVLAASRLAS
jgi:hypothetical protein